MPTQETEHRRRFWIAFAQVDPVLCSRMERGNESSRWLSVTSQPIVIAHYISGDSIGIFVRAQRGAETGVVRPLLVPRASEITRALDTELEPSWSRHFLAKRIMLDMADEKNWPIAINWFSNWSPKYETTLKRIA